MDQYIISLFESYPVFSVLLAGIMSIHPLASFIVGFTKTPSADSNLKKFYSFIEKIALVTKKTKED